MVKLRRNHTTSERGTAHAGRMGVFLVFCVVLLVVLAYVVGQKKPNQKGFLPVMTSSGSDLNKHSASDRDYIPQGGNYEVVDHTYYSLGYSEKHEQAAWVAYPLTAESIYAPNVKRSNWFAFDTMVSTHSAAHRDYKGSGYTRGHLAPAGDMAFNKQAMEESFFMSNMSPQIRHFNGGIWKELEENVRDWAVKKDKLYIVTGPILTGANKQIGKNNKIAVPRYFYKALLDIDGTQEGVAFVIPHEVSDKPLTAYMCSIDSLEKVIGLDLYAGLSSKMDADVENHFDKNQWRYTKKKYNDRVQKWNHQ